MPRAAPTHMEEVILLGEITHSGVDALLALPSLRHLIIYGRDDYSGEWRRETDGTWRECGSRGIPLEQ